MAHYVDYEQAKWLKIIGFNEECKYYYDFIGDICSSNNETNWNISNETLYSRPEQHQVVNWLLEKHGIHIKDDFEREYSFEKDKVISTKYRCYVNKFVESISGYDFKFKTNLFDSPKEAYSAAFNILNNNLI